MSKYKESSEHGSEVRLSTSRSGKSNKTLYMIVGALAVASTVAVAVAVPIAIQSNPTVKSLLETAKSILEKAPAVDGHNDWPWQLRDHRQNVINNISLKDDFTKYYPNSHTDIPRLREGKVGAQFWACYVRCSSQGKDAVRQGLEQMDMIRRMIDADPDTFVFAKTANDIEEAQKNSKIASLIGVEGGHMIDSSLAALRMLFALGARYMTLTHSCPTPWAGNASSSMGLTEFGKSVVKEMNRLGMLIDLSHVSDQVMIDAMETSRAPIIYSHSSARALCNHSRNIPDDILLKVKENNGIVMVNFYNNYVTCNDSATTSDVADHYDHIKNITGVDHLGLGADYDGVPRVPEGLEDVSKYPNLIAELLKRHWTEEELMKITRQNILRVMKRVEAVAEEMKNTKPDETWIPQEEITNEQCRTG